MKSKPTPFLSLLWPALALALATLPTLHAQEKTPPVVPATTEQAAPVLRSVDADQPAPSTDAPAADDKKVEEKEVGTTTEAAQPAPEKKSAKRVRNPGHKSGNERVSFGHDSTLAAGESADAVVSIMGSSTSAGTVGDAVVSIIGNSRVTGGTVGDSVVAVLGNVYVNGEVKGEIVAVLGNVELGPDAIVGGEIVCIGGEIKRDPRSVHRGTIQNIALAGRHFDFAGLHTWFQECLLYARPLAFNSNLMWAWWIALAALGFYALLALVAPAGVTKCVATLEERPGYSVLTCVLSLLLTPVAYLLLALTLFIGIGFVLIPLFTLGLFFAAIFGKVVMLAWLGRRLTKLFGDGPLAHPVFAVLIGGSIVLGLYTVPVLGFIVYKLLGFLGLGVVLYTMILMFKASRPAPVPRPVPAAPVPPGVGVEDVTAGATALVQLPPVISAATLPRAGFWHRFLASLLDAIIVGMAFGLLRSMWHGVGGIFPFWFAVYCVIMWATKATTIGGIICGLKVVRLDDRPLDWGVAIVRALSAFLSLAVAGLGFIWVAFDDEKQSWHDKIAGTTIVRVPKGTPLL